MAKIKLIKRTPPLSLPELDISEVAAIKALNACAATPIQQEIALQAILKKFCGLPNLSFDPASQDVTIFNEGKRAVGVMIMQVIQVPQVEFTKK